MKTLHFALRALAFVCIAFFMSSASCELFENADDISFTAVLDHGFDIHEGLSFPDGKAYATEPEDEVLDAGTVNQDFAKHADKIESITINKVTYVVSGYSSSCPNDVGFSGGTLTFSDPDGGGTGGIVKNVSHTSLKAIQGSEQILTFTQSEADELANLLKEKKKVRIHAAGFLSCTPLFLNVKATLDCTIKARVL
jgi:hypothetical protein